MHFDIGYFALQKELYLLPYYYEYVFDCCNLITCNSKQITFCNKKYHNALHSFTHFLHNIISIVYRRPCILFLIFPICYVVVTYKRHYNLIF